MNMQFVVGLLATCLIYLTSSTVKAEYEGSTVDKVWGQVMSDPYHSLPQRRVSVWSFFSGFKDRLLESSKRTLNDSSDLLPPFRKLLHPNGICLKGTWNITEDTPYSGVFTEGSSMPIIARASTALSNTRSGQNRAFSFAGKIFPVGSGETHIPAETANFFTIEDLGGNYKPYFLDADNTNDIIKVSPSFTLFMNSLLGAIVAKDFAIADKSTPATTLIRELYPLSEAGLTDKSEAVTPIWLKITGASDMPRIDAADFRDELDIANYPDGLYFDIWVASEGFRLGKKDWQLIGNIEFTESVVSKSCDTRLHFHHPRSRTLYVGALQIPRN